MSDPLEPRAAPQDPSADPARCDPAPADPAGLAAARHSAIVATLADEALLAIEGADAATFLQSQLSNDVNALSPERCQYTSYNSPKGRVLANFVLWPTGAESYAALLPADIAASIAKRLRLYVLRSRVTIIERTPETGILGVGGRAAELVLRQALGVAPALFGVERTGEATVLALPGPRFVVVAPRPAIDALRERLARHARPADAAAWRWLTVDAGVPVVTAATQEQFVAQMIHWDVLGGVSFQKGCYPGQEIVARTRYLGRLKERLYALHAPVASAPGERIFGSVFGDTPCGTVVNAAAAPEQGWDLLAVVQIAAADARDLRLGAPDGPRLEHRALPYALPVAPQPKR